MKKLIPSLLLPLLFACTSPDPQPDNTPQLRTLSAVESTLVTSSNDFAFSLFKKLQSSETPNQFLSPLSVGIALGMTLNGAEGETRQGILNTIQFGTLTDSAVNRGYRDLCSLLTGMDKTVHVRIANSVWHREQLVVQKTFKSTIESHYGGTVQGLDFASPQSKNTINNWIAAKTNNAIKDVVDDISSELIMFLINAIHFKGDWTYTFDKSKTRDDKFFLENGTSVKTLMMQSDGAVVASYRHEKFQLITIPFGNQQFEFNVLLPNEMHSVEEVATLLNADALNNWIQQSDTIRAILRMPKFTLKWKKRLNNELASLGMEQAFSGRAQFPYFFEQPLGLKIGFVDHVAFLEVNEAGAEAAAVTVVGIELTNANPTPAVISINRPFLFLIREKHSGAILFLGQLKNPELL